MVYRDDGTAAGEGTRSNGLIQLEWWQTPEADQVRHHFQWVWLFSRGRAEFCHFFGQTRSLQLIGLPIPAVRLSALGC